MKFLRCVWLGALQGLMVWAAYAVVEFVSSPVLYRLTRPYAVFTSWTWGLTSLLIAAYLATGAAAGILAGIAVYLASGKAAQIERTATLILVVVFGANVLASPSSLVGRDTLLALSIALAGLLIAALVTERWAQRLWLLLNPVVIAILLLGTGREIALLQLQASGEQLGSKAALASGLLIASLVVVALAAFFFGRKLSSRAAADRPFVLNRAALACAVALLAGSAWLGRGASASGLPSPALSGNSASPNVLLVVMDTVRADHLSLYGYSRDTTPNLKALAEDSTLYTETIAPSDFTLTSHASLFTGMYGSWHGAHCQPPDATYGRALEPDIPTLAEVLSSHGYSTLGVAANLYLRKDFGLQKGFQTFQIPRPVPVLPDEDWFLLRTVMRKMLSLVVDTAQFDRLYSRGEDINKKFFSTLGAAAVHTPFFAFLNYMDAHFPYGPPAPYDTLFPGKDYTATQESLTDTQSKVVHGAPLPAAYAPHCLSQYDGGIVYMDAQIGQLVRWLKDRGLYDNTMIVVTSDHGEAFGEKGLFEHANSVYQNLLHVVLLIKYPQSAHKGVVSDPVSLIDVMPTTLGVLGYATPKNVQGKNLLDAPAPGPRELFGESFACPVIHPADCPPEGCLSRAVVSWPNKFVTSSNGKREMYDLAIDPNEDRNLFVLNDPTVQRLVSDLTAWTKSIPAKMQQHLKLDPDALKRLRGLGYVNQ